MNSNTLAAIFATADDARESLKDLHKAGFKQTWLGVTKPGQRAGEPLVEQPGSAIARFIALQDDAMPLHRALLEHGLTEQQAREIDRDIAVGCAVVTVYGEDNPQRASQVLSAHKGDVVASNETPDAVARASESPRTGVPKDERKAAESDREIDPRTGERTGERAGTSRVDTIRGDEYDYGGQEFVEMRSGGRDRESDFDRTTR